MNTYSPQIHLSAVTTSIRQTSKNSFGSKVQQGFIRAGTALGNGLQVVAPFIPGGVIVSAALANSVKSVVGPAPVSTQAGYMGQGVNAFPGTGGVLAQDSRLQPAHDLMQAGFERNYQLLTVQNQIQQHSQQFNLRSNLLKAEYEATRSAINNLRT